MRKVPPLVSLLVLVLLAFPVGAQTSPTIEQGVFDVTGHSSSTVIRFTLSGPNLLTLSGAMRDGNHNPACTPCVGGQIISVFDWYSGSLSFLPGTLSTGGATQPVYYDGNVIISGLPTTLPFRYNRYVQTIVMPITLEGTLQVHSAPPFSSPHLLFEIPLNLEGTATMRFRTRFIDSPNQYAPVYEILSLTYEFHPPAQIE